jgi:hemoglobin
MKQIETKDDIALLVNTFYGKVLKDEALSPFFAHLDFEKHKPQMIHFWAFVLLNEPDYRTNVTEKHLHMPLKKEHFDRWLFLFNETLDELFTGDLVEMAKQRATTIAWTINHKIEHYNKEGN